MCTLQLPGSSRGTIQVPWSVMFPLVLEHAFLVADGLLGTTCVQADQRFWTVCRASDLRKGAPKPQTAIGARGFSRDEKRQSDALSSPR